MGSVVTLTTLIRSGVAPSGGDPPPVPLKTFEEVKASYPATLNFPFSFSFPH